MDGRRIPALALRVSTPEPQNARDVAGGGTEHDRSHADEHGRRPLAPELGLGRRARLQRQIVIHSGLSNGTSEATLTPWYGKREGEPVVRPYGVDLPTPGSDFLWDPMPDYGLGHLFDETLRDCDFVGERLVAVGDVFGQHEADVNPKQPQQTRPRLLEMEGDPAWHVAGPGPGNTTQALRR